MIKIDISETIKHNGERCVIGKFLLIKANPEKLLPAQWLLKKGEKIFIPRAGGISKIIKRWMGSCSPRDYFFKPLWLF